MSRWPNIFISFVDGVSYASYHSQKDMASTAIFQVIRWIDVASNQLKEFQKIIDKERGTLRYKDHLFKHRDSYYKENKNRSWQHLISIVGIYILEKV